MVNKLMKLILFTSSLDLSVMVLHINKQMIKLSRSQQCIASCMFDKHAYCEITFKVVKKVGLIFTQIHGYQKSLVINASKTFSVFPGFSCTYLSKYPLPYFLITIDIHNLFSFFPKKVVKHVLTVQMIPGNFKGLLYTVLFLAY